MLPAFPIPIGQVLHQRSDYATRHTLDRLAAHRWEISPITLEQDTVTPSTRALLSYSDNFCLCELREHLPLTTEMYEPNVWTSSLITTYPTGELCQFFGLPSPSLTSMWQKAITALSRFQIQNYGVDHYAGWLDYSTVLSPTTVAMYASGGIIS